MTKAELIARVDSRIRPILLRFPPYLVTLLYSNSRKYFLRLLENENIKNPYTHPPQNNIRLWELNFACNLFNSAGMFKNGGGYYMVAKQGAGAYLAGTTTFLMRSGNLKKCVKHPFIPYPNSFSASNWMGLPNLGHAEVAKALSKIQKIPGCPIGISISSSPEQKAEDELKGITEGMKLFESAGVDFIELNESCPNVPHENSTHGCTGIDGQLIQRLEYINQNFLIKRKRNIPVIVKFSTDTSAEQLPLLIDVLLTLGFDGINLGNTSTDYEGLRNSIEKNDLKSFDYFTNSFGGGLSGRVLKSKSLGLSKFAVDYIGKKSVSQEFHVIRTGGIEAKEDLEDSNAAGIMLNQWFTGYFENFSKFGHDVYRNIFGYV